MNDSPYLLLALLTLVSVLPPAAVAYLAIWVIRRNAPRWGLLDRPGGHKSHAEITPLGGGLGIWAGVLTTFLVITLLAWFQLPDSWQEGLPSLWRDHRTGLLTKLDSLWVILGAGSLLVILGLLDDRFGLDWKLRIGVQFGLATVCVISQGWQLTAFINVQWFTLGLSVVWIVALINSFNMLDNMDGLSGGVALIAAAMLAAVLLVPASESNDAPQLFVGSFLLVIVGALAGFLAHNLPPAKIFMGDAGSYFVGFCIAVATLLATYTGYHSPKPHAILAPLFVMAVPLYDMLSVIIIRLREGRSPFHADRCHLSHRLVELGLSRWQAVCTIYLLTGTCGIAALLLQRVDGLGAGLLLMLVLCVLALIAILETTARRQLRL